ncbi:MAG TPA: gamma-glutamyl-gamma-aminobutyrate hydrolase family protein [Rectinemataceae bacterium]
MDFKPRIGITSFSDRQGTSDYFCVGERYCRSVSLAGGIPLVLPIGEREEASGYVDNFDALLLSGGKDLDPELYGQDPMPGLGLFDRRRDDWELALLAATRKEGKPILGICRGFQLINVASGGSLFQDASLRQGSKAHRLEGYPLDRLFHSIRVSESSILATAVGTSSIRVNSSHHQLIDRLGSGLRATAWASDGAIEAFEPIEALDGAFLLGVQFHPEALALNHKPFLGIFKALVAAASSQP